MIEILIMSKQGVGIVQLAKELGVNIGTVSRALNGKAGVGEELRQRIALHAKAKNYRPNHFAHAPLTRRTFRVGVVGKAGSDSFFANPFWGQILSGVEEGAGVNGYDLLIGASREGADKQGLLIPSFLLGERVDGVIAVNEIQPEVIEVIRQRNVPCVQIDFQGDAAFPAVVTEHESGAHAATRHLLELGHRHLMFFGDAHAHPNFAARLKGFQNAANEEGAVTVTVSRAQTPRLYEGLPGYRVLLLELLRAHPQTTAIFFQNDVAAVRAKSILIDEGVRIPEDLSLIGFDDVAMSSEVFPALTTMRVDKSRMGRMAFDLLLARMDGKAAAQMHAFPAELVIRATTSRPRAGELKLSAK